MNIGHNQLLSTDIPNRVFVILLLFVKFFRKICGICKPNRNNVIKYLRFCNGKIWVINDKKVKGQKLIKLSA